MKNKLIRSLALVSLLGATTVGLTLPLISCSETKNVIEPKWKTDSVLKTALSALIGKNASSTSIVNGRLEKAVYTQKAFTDNPETEIVEIKFKSVSKATTANHYDITLTGNGIDKTVFSVLAEQDSVAPPTVVIRWKSDAEITTELKRLIDGDVNLEAVKASLNVTLQKNKFVTNSELVAITTKTVVATANPHFYDITITANYNDGEITSDNIIRNVEAVQAPILPLPSNTQAFWDTNKGVWIRDAEQRSRTSIYGRPTDISSGAEYANNDEAILAKAKSIWGNKLENYDNQGLENTPFNIRVEQNLQIWNKPFANIQVRNPDLFRATFEGPEKAIAFVTADGLSVVFRILITVNFPLNQVIGSAQSALNVVFDEYFHTNPILISEME